MCMCHMLGVNVQVCVKTQCVKTGPPKIGYLDKPH